MKIWVCQKQYKVVVMKAEDGSYVCDFYDIKKAFTNTDDAVEFMNEDHSEKAYEFMNKRYAMSNQVVYVNHDPRTRWESYDIEK
jgi:hypothetical protein